jgi:hypothetical protein
MRSFELNLNLVLQVNEVLVVATSSLFEDFDNSEQALFI